MRRHVGLDGREYKLLLDPKELKGRVPGGIAEELARIARKAVGTESRGTFKATDRIVRFWDTAGRHLREGGYALRERREGSLADLSLKLRSPDLFIIASTALPAIKGKSQTKVEEDIGPLQVADRKGELSIRSLFAISTKVPMDGVGLARMSDVYRIFGSLEASLGPSPAGAVPILPGPTIEEMVYRGVEVPLDDEVEADVDLTLWHFRGGGKVKDIAEISFTCKVENGLLGAIPARRALDLFVRMQKKLPVHRRVTSKTALALP